MARPEKPEEVMDSCGQLCVCLVELEHAERADAEMGERHRKERDESYLQLGRARTALDQARSTLDRVVLGGKR